MPSQIRARPPTAQAQMRPTAVNSRPITGQPVAAAASRGVAMAGMTHPQNAAVMAQAGARPAAYPAGPRQMPGQPGRPMPQVMSLSFVVSFCLKERAMCHYCVFHVYQSTFHV